MGVGWQTSSLFLLFFSFTYMMATTLVQAALYAFIVTILILLLYHHKHVQLMIVTFPRDIKAALRFLKLNLRIYNVQKKNMSVPDMFATYVKKHPNKVAFIFEDDEWTFKQVSGGWEGGGVIFHNQVVFLSVLNCVSHVFFLMTIQVDEFSNQVANYFLNEGFKKGDVVGLFMENSIVYVATWLGLAKIGVVPALLNYNLREHPLVHCIKVAQSKAVIFCASLLEAINEIRPDLDGNPLYMYGEPSEGVKVHSDVRLDKVLLEASKEVPAPEKKPGFTDKLIYIFTSGTTGLPKAAVIKHSRYHMAASATYYMMKLKSSDVVYDPLPLYHTAGGVMGIGLTLLHGAVVVIRKKFSVTHFWLDCVKYKCTFPIHSNFHAPTMSTHPGMRKIGYHFMASGVHYLGNLSNREMIYNPLPLYHTAGTTLGIGQVILFGCSAYIRKKFSASHFWEEAAKYQCTVAQYIGEICRYLLSTPQKPEETQHCVHTIFGNGLRPQIWEQFQNRFKVKNIIEFYGSTEGNANIINVDNRIGAIGFKSLILPGILPVTLIRVDEATGEPIRNSKGMCIHCAPGEPGEFVGKIQKNHPIRDFEGYADVKSTTKKIIHNVFEQGDTCFRSGDMLVMDEYGYLYFKDRTGDTFRWRGENVSTSEVEAVISNIIGLADSVVYGVQVPGVEGRAGMCAIHDPEGGVDLSGLVGGMKKSLAPYARPLFIRLVKQLDATGTYKLKKLDLQKEGFDPNKVSDPLFFLDPSKNEYVPITQQLYDNIITGKVRL
ncbi:unnamed protein product [Darwinula stevensoni]|uniref:long-chain-fatty-acid--CoA ligase n=1 Tax=Darwinula stevensoni TaxID=69355 RepID=A0A7R8X5A3_9CRUS|nr:unnamed protein product [Darwinula stevensoni]CAG0886912.1 unnamed protein product [Darwinula stevensoni]